MTKEDLQRYDESYKWWGEFLEARKEALCAMKRLGMSVWLVPLLIAHGSSAAFNLGIGLCIVTVVTWIGAYKLVFGK